MLLKAFIKISNITNVGKRFIGQKFRIVSIDKFRTQIRNHVFSKIVSLLFDFRPLSIKRIAITTGVQTL